MDQKNRVFLVEVFEKKKKNKITKVSPLWKASASKLDLLVSKCFFFFHELEKVIPTIF